MAIDRTPGVRADFPFLTRRVKPAAVSAVAPSAAQSAAAPVAPEPTGAPRPACAPPSLSLSRPRTPLGTQPPPAPANPRISSPPSLSLGLSPAPEASAARSGTPGNGSTGNGSARSASPARITNPAARLFPAPEIHEVRTLDEKAPLVRLSPLQSAMGSLLVTGTRGVVWEAADLTTGARTMEGTPSGITGTEVPTSGNRPLLGYVEEVAVVPLRHIGELRRALFLPQPGSTMLVEIYDGGSVAVPFEATDPAGSTQPLMQVLSLLRVGNQVELRAEPLPTGLNPREIWAEFGFAMTESVHSSLRRK